MNESKLTAMVLLLIVVANVITVTACYLASIKLMGVGVEMWGLAFVTDRWERLS